MGRGKKGYNWKSREVVKTTIDDSATKKIKLELEAEGKYDESNPLVLPSQKRKTKVKHIVKQQTKLLSAKQRKHLEKIVDKKKKKENRATLLESLAKVQATPEELKQYTSITTTQTKGLKRLFHEQEYGVKKVPKVDQVILDGTVQINSLSGSKRLRLQALKEDIKVNDPNVVGFDSSSSDDDEDEEESDQESGIEVENVNENEAENTNENEVENTNGTEEVNMADTNEEKIADESEEVTQVEAPKDVEQVVVIKDDKVEEVKVKSEIKVERKKAVFIPVDRDESIQAARLKLPILAEEQIIMEKIMENDIVLLAGETGSGKTTQVPQFLYEAGYAENRLIGVTEPRRVAAISMSKRVGEEMNLPPSQISYLIRFEGNVTDETKIKFMTDGVLLKEVQKDFLLKKYSVIILDEAHERSVYTDILIGLLSRIVPLRRKRKDPLKLIIMSATLRLEDFTENERLFKVTPPVVKVEARQYPVTVHFNKHTYDNYVKEAFTKAAKVHTKLPEGGILIFVTGQQEVNLLVNKLRKAFPLKQKKKYLAAVSDADLNSDLKNRRKKIRIVPRVNLDDFTLPDCEDGDADDDDDCEIDDLNFNDAEAVIPRNAQPLWVLPLYSLLPSHRQAKVFQPPPFGCRLCVVSTNVAETSLTIPHIKYVIDSGKTKVKLYDKITGVSSYVVTWTSKASADQRAGRAGRTAPGHCYRLYSSAIFNDVFVKFGQPEIQQKPVDDLYLQMKCMNISKVVNFPFPTAPDLLQLRTAEARLETLGALKDHQVTPLGRAIARFPVQPRFGKMLALSHQHDLLAYTILLVAALSVQEVLLETPIGQDEDKSIRQRWFATRTQWAGVGNSLLLGDAMVLLKAVGAAEYANSEHKLELFCNENGLRHKAVVEIRKLRTQLTNEIKSNVPDVDIVVDPKLQPPTDLHAKLLRQILLAGMGDQVARKIMPDELQPEDDKSKFKYAYRANNMEQPVHMHHSSVLKRTLPEFVIYQEIYETNRIYMRGVTAIEPEWLVKFVPHLCNLSEPLSEPTPRYDAVTGKIFCTVNGTFGPQAWPLQHTEIVYENALGAYKWFACAFLEGKVCKALEKYKSSLLSAPSLMVKTWARMQMRADAILKALMNGKVCSRDKLAETWREDPKFLKAEYFLWLPQSAQAEVSLLWPPEI